MSNHQPNQTRRDEEPKDERKKRKRTKRQPSRPGAAGQGQESQREKHRVKEREKRMGLEEKTRRGGDLLQEEHAEYDSTTNSNKKTADEQR